MVFVVGAASETRSPSPASRHAHQTNSEDNEISTAAQGLWDAESASVEQRSGNTVGCVVFIVQLHRSNKIRLIVSSTLPADADWIFDLFVGHTRTVFFAINIACNYRPLIDSNQCEVPALLIRVSDGYQCSSTRVNSTLLSRSTAEELFVFTISI